MSSRAEIAALEAYPPTHPEGKRHAKRVQSESVDTHQPVRTIFQKGYELAEKDFGWISVKDRLPEISGFYFTCVEDNGHAQCVGVTFFNAQSEWEDDYDSFEIVDYWMPIPKLPMEEEK